MSETPREAASKLVSEWVPALERQQPNYLHPLIDAIEAALDARDERCAKIAETAYEQFQTGYNAGKYIAQKIRGKD